jgi:hypothetical protein
MGFPVFRFLLLPAFALTLLTGSLNATTLRTMTEDEQIQKADTIFRGRAEQIDAAFESRANGRAIVTTVRFTPLTVYKGAAESSVSLKFVGGKVGDVEMKVGGMPQFVVGQEYILFVSTTGNSVCPVVGWAEGSLKVDRRSNAAGVVSVSPDVTGAAEPAISARSRAVLTDGETKLPDFEKRLRARIARMGAKP